MSSVQRAIATIVGVVALAAIAIWMILSPGSSKKDASPTPSSSSTSVVVPPDTDSNDGAGPLASASTSGAATPSTTDDGDGVADPENPDPSSSSDSPSAEVTPPGESSMDLTKGAGKTVSDFANVTNGGSDTTDQTQWEQQVKQLVTDDYYKKAYAPGANSAMTELDKIKAANGGGNGANKSDSQGIDKSSMFVTPVISQPQTDTSKVLHVSYRLYQDDAGQRHYGDTMSMTYFLKNVNGTWRIDDVQSGAE